MLSLLLSSLLALAQAAPTTKSAAPSNSVPANLIRDYATVSKFAKTVSGPQTLLSNWTNSDICSWNGFFCAVNPDTNDLSLASIDFNGFQMTGNLKLTGWIDKLADLALLHLNSNSFSGEIPDFSQMQYLYELDLSNNKFSGAFPEKVFTAHGLTFLDLRYNRFTGAIPAQTFTTYPQIEALFLNNNRFSGQIPASIAGFQGNYLSLANNQLSGPIPASLASAANLKELTALGNKFSGEIPQGLGALSQLEVFDVSNNRLTGAVPEDLCAIQTLKALVVSGNKISSTLGPNCQRALANGILKM
ncbi:hypothetical protein yc1106_06565 [Curvularia clavata]|uniref:Leucine-rich repeat-containing N-terminal plant-type domain-containing protein n=1 Tax=Curvularia clavata TaxID=95742 RepID=A0A9Q8ZBR2_CURCL|nr:hypothetical protein yc1106_06565 [Curvularia clavata]